MAIAHWKTISLHLLASTTKLLGSFEPQAHYYYCHFFYAIPNLKLTCYFIQANTVLGDNPKDRVHGEG